MREGLRARSWMLPSSAARTSCSGKPALTPGPCGTRRRGRRRACRATAPWRRLAVSSAPTGLARTKRPNAAR
eukprot:11174295-Lingulodinium_polyedra.AAC.1